MKRWTLVLLAVVLIGTVVYREFDELVNIAAVLMYTAAFSLLLSPVCTLLERKRLSPAAAAGITVIGLFLFAFLILAACIPYLISRADYLFKRIAPAFSSLLDWMMQSNSLLPSWVTLNDSGIMGVSLGGITRKMVKSGMVAMAQIGRIGFALVLTYYVLCDRKRIGNHLLLIVPGIWRNQVLAALCACRNAMMSYLSGLIKTSIFVASATLAGLLILRVQDAFLLALLMGICEILPYLGPILAAIPILLSALMQGAETALFVFLLLIAIQQIEGNLISPYFTASSTSIHPFAAVLSVFVMGSLLGIWGILFAVPVAIMVQSIYLSVCQARYMMKGSA